MKYFLLAILTLVFHSLSFAQEDTIQIKIEYWKSGVKKKERIFTSLFSFRFKEWYINGQIASEGYFNDDLHIKHAWDSLGNKIVNNGEGKQSYLFDNGTVSSEGGISKERLHGVWVYYHQNGLKKEEGNFQYGRKYGLWTIWNENGEKAEERKYTNNFFEYWNAWNNGKQIIKNGDGYLIEKYSDLNIKAEGPIKNGKKWGNWKEYYKNGNVKYEYKFVEWTGNFRDETQYKFIFINAWDSLGNVSSFNGTGNYDYLDDSGKVIFRIFYKNGLEDSLRISYHPNGKPEIVDSYKNEVWTYRIIYYDNGNKAYEFNRKYSYDHDGVVKSWYYGGQLKLQQLFDKGKLIKETGYYKSGNKKYESANCKEVGDFYSSEIQCDYKSWDNNGNLIENK